MINAYLPYPTIKCLHALVLKKHVSFLIQSCDAALHFPLCLKRSVLAPVTLRPALSWIPDLLWLVSSTMLEPATLATIKQLLNQFLRANLGINYANVWWPHRIKGYIFGYICVPVFMIITICECTICEDIKVRPKQSTFDNLYWQINVSETLC